MATAGYLAQIRATGTATPMTQEACSAVAGTSSVTWGIDAASKDLWDHNTTFTVEASEDGGSTWATLAASEFSLNYLLGRVDLDAYASGSATVANLTNVRVSGKYLPRYVVLGGRTCSGTLGPAELMSSVYQNAGEARVYGRQDVSWDVESLERQATPLDGAGGSEDSLYDKIQSEVAFVFEARPNDNSDRFFRSWVKIMGNAEDFSGGSLNTTTITLSGAQQSAAMSSQSVKLWAVKF